MQRKEEEILRSSESVMSRSKHVEEQLVASCGIETSTALVKIQPVDCGRQLATTTVKLLVDSGVHK